MSSTGALHSGPTQNQQHPFLFQPQHHPYSSGDDGDSPPSLTNSSESPRSVSEEGDVTSSTSFGGLFDHNHNSNKSADNPLQSRRADAQSQLLSGNQIQQTLEAGSIPVETEDSLMSPVQAASPNWESVFGSGDVGGDDMDLTATTNAELDPRQWASLPSEHKQVVLPLNSNGVTIQGQSSSTPKKEVTEMWTNGTFTSNLWPENKVSDEAMFDSLIQENSFEHTDSSQADFSAQKGTSGPVTGNLDTSNQLSINTAPSSLPRPSQGNSTNGINGVTPPQSAQPSTSAQSSRRNSNETQERKPAKIPHCGSHYSHTSDADLPTSSQVVVRPPPSELSGLQVHVHGISFTGAKSRVETQIRTRIELVRPTQEEGKDSSSETAFERIGSFNHVKLPPLTGTKRKSKKHKPADISAEKTLFMDATVVRATPPHDRVLVCASCQQRERKRAQRKRIGNRRGDQRAADDDSFTLEELQEYGIDPKAPDAQDQARRRASQEDEKRVVVFNCGDFISFDEGACVLPTRITCYCRHHKEKTGFCLIFTMRDYQGNLIATGSTPPIMITDDHKSVAAAQAAAVASSSTSSGLAKKTDGARSRAASSEMVDEASMRSIGKEAAFSKRKRSNRTRPYGDADERASRRSTLQSATMTPFTTNGQNTPAVCQSPSSQLDLNQPEFWNAFAAMSTMASPPVSSQASHGGQTPLDGPSPLNQTSPSHQHNNTNGHDWLASLGNQGSLSSQTLQLSPQSLPGFDLGAFSRSLHQSSQQAGDEATMQQLLMLARSLPGTGSSGMQSLGSNGNTVPIPAISKLIPGEGPTSGGIEVTVLGENFTDNLTCLFGDVPATSTKVWGSNTLLCILPPSASPGPVAVSIKGAPGMEQARNGQDQYGRSLQLFTYVDTTDRALMELALQVVGLQMTGQMQTARDVAMRVVGSGHSQGMTRNQPLSTSPQQQQQMRSAVPGLSVGGSSNQSFQDSVLQFLTTLDTPVGARRTDAIRLANKQGHTLLHLAVILGFHRLALDLTQRGCPINARDHNGYTALHFAALHGRMTIARLLLSRGARADVECDAGKIPIDVAREREQLDVEMLLEECMAVSSVDETEEDETDDAESDWLTDEEEVDSNIISSEQGDDDSRINAVDLHLVADVHGDRSATKTVTADSPLPSTADEKAMLKTAIEDSKGSDEKSHESKSGLKGLVSGGMDMAQRWPHAAMGKMGMPTGILSERFHMMHMPAVSVFQMVLPPTLMNWTGAGESSANAADASDKGKVKEASSTMSTEETNRASTMWRSILEESALWINPLYSPPPPTYESALHSKHIGSSSSPQQEESTRKGAAASRFPAIAQASPDSPHKGAIDVPSQSRGTDMRGASWSSASSSSSLFSSLTPAQSSSSTSLLVSRTPTKSMSTTSALPTRPATSSRRRGESGVGSKQLKEDRMLVYFWLPALVFVILLLFFAKPSSVLSYKDLVSFLPT